MKKLTVLTILILTLAVTVSACFVAQQPPQETNNDTEISDAEDQNQSDNETNIAELKALYGEPIELTNDLVPEVYQANIGENISVNAEVIVPDNFSFGNAVVNGTLFLNEDKIRDIFINGNSRKETAGDNIYYYGDDGSEVIIAEQKGDIEWIAYYSGGDCYNNRGIQSIETEGHNLYRTFIKGGSTLIEPTVNNLFGKTEITGFDRGDAIGIVREKMDALGIECETEPEVFVIDSEGVAKYRKNFKERNPNSTLLNESEFSSEDDAYLILFNLACNQMPINYEFWFDYNNIRGYDSTYAYGVVSRKGLLEFNSPAGYTVTDMSEEVLKLYNVDILEKVLKNNYDLRLISDPIEFISVKLEYVCTSGNTENVEDLILEPCWVCYYNKTVNVNGRDRIYTKFLFIKAATGELLDTDGADL